MQWRIVVHPTFHCVPQAFEEMRVQTTMADVYIALFAQHMANGGYHTGEQ